MAKVMLREKEGKTLFYGKWGQATKLFEWFY